MGRESDVKIVDVEQLSPFPWDLVDRELRRYPNAEVVWCQEEPMNMGAWAHVAPRFQTLFKQPHVNRPLDALAVRRQGAPRPRPPPRGTDPCTPRNRWGWSRRRSTTRRERAGEGDGAGMTNGPSGDARAKGV